ncbi:hypothetical protein AMS68_003147 [Peltaster fructicola]|uniref:Uncharacterized protein n=1 Tax=Peltaster fructicola TaxID=286661 RepID=A0A6H0XT43_9PEZI|nr:hypothetical protein AMS68_003147 [Peltaster fructicola]
MTDKTKPFILSSPVATARQAVSSLVRRPDATKGSPGVSLAIDCILVRTFGPAIAQAWTMSRQASPEAVKRQSKSSINSFQPLSCSSLPALSSIYTDILAALSIIFLSRP